ncbi:hypothetical protein BC829DRAFT_235306 [Chytridium lagenaria]|nr:hypothetical protein BC829DRAFT_235306 [Chytridium lagenaria]
MGILDTRSRRPLSSLDKGTPSSEKQTFSFPSTFSLKTPTKSMNLQTPTSSPMKLGETSEARLSIDMGQLTLKELDFERLLQARQSNLLHFGAERKRQFLEQMELDIGILKRYSFMDYSVLIGVHRKKVGRY